MFVMYRAVNGTRTRDIRLGKPTLYQLSYYRNSLIDLSRKCGADTRTRTGDPRITNALLYQLSHIGLYRISDAKVIHFVEVYARYNL